MHAADADPQTPSIRVGKLEKSRLPIYLDAREITAASARPSDTTGKNLTGI